MTSAASTAQTSTSAIPDETFTFKSGELLYGEFFAAAEPRGAVLIVHGYAEHCGRYRDVASHLRARGLSVMTFDIRGHGRASGQRGYTDDFDAYLDDLQAATTALRDRTGTSLPLYAVAHSNGGLILLRALCEQARDIAFHRAVISSPFLGLKLKVNPIKRFVGLALGRVWPRFSMKNELRVEDLTSDPVKQREREQDQLCHEAASSGWFRAALRAQAYVADHAGRIDTPLLWLVAGDDQIADPAISESIHAKLGAHSEFQLLSGLQHEILNEVGRDDLYEVVAKYLLGE